MSRFAISARVLVPLLIALTATSLGICAPRSDADKSVKGEGVIDRVIVTGSEPVFQAGGYRFRINAATEVQFGRDLQSLSEVETNTWAIFEGRLDTTGEIVATKVTFAKMKIPKRESASNTEQVTTFPPDSKIDGDNGFGVGPSAFPPEDHGGWCGWYDITDNPALQEQIRRLGMKIVPKYQRDLPADDPAKIPFRFYVVEEREIRSDIFCGDGLVLVPANVVKRLESEEQLLAAVLADGIAGELQLQAGHAPGFKKKDAVALAAVGSFGVTGGLVVHEVYKRIAEHERGRMALAFMTDAGFDPREAPEAWRLLAPFHLPKDTSELSYPERSQYLQNILKEQYKAVPGASFP
jgi:hypothetical protein